MSHCVRTTEPEGVGVGGIFLVTCCCVPKYCPFSGTYLSSPRGLDYGDSPVVSVVMEAIS